MVDSQITILFKHSSELTPIELYKILKLRSDVFIVEGKCYAPDVDGEDLDEHMIHCFAIDETNNNNNVVGYVRLQKLSGRSCIFLRRVCVDKKFRGSGLANDLLESVVQYCRQLKSQQDPNERVASIEIHARAYLEKFYNRFGFTRCSEEYYNESINLPEVEMELDL